MTIFIDKKGEFYDNETSTYYTEKEFPNKKFKGGVIATKYKKDEPFREGLEKFFKVAYSLKNKDFYLLKNFIIKKKYRGEGLGSKLRSQVIKKILADDVKIICSQPWSIDSNFSHLDLKNFYIKNFKENGAKEVFVEKTESGIFAVVGIF